MKQILLHTRLLLFIAFAMAGMSSCIDDHDSCQQLIVEEEEGIYLRFHIAAKVGAETRVDDIEGVEEGSGLENLISLDTGTLRYLIFDKNQRFLCDITAASKTVASSGFFALYEVTAKLEDKYFLDNLDENLDFYILALANVGTSARYWGITWPSLQPGVDTMASLFESGIPMPGDVDRGGLIETTSLMSNVATSSRIPMAGLQHFNFHGSMLLTASENMPYDISLATGKDLNLLRALAKIEIIDKINIGEGKVFDKNNDDNSLRLKQLFLCGYMSEGLLLPTFTQWQNDVPYPETQQVIAPRIPQEIRYNIPVPIETDNLAQINLNDEKYARPLIEDQAATNAREDKCPVYSIYVFEYSKMSEAQVPISQQPYFVVSTKGDADNEPLTFPVRMAKYTNGSATADDNLSGLLRNHIYRFEISAIQQQLTVNWTVCPMDDATANITFN